MASATPPVWLERGEELSSAWMLAGGSGTRPDQTPELIPTPGDGCSACDEGRRGSSANAESSPWGGNSGALGRSPSDAADGSLAPPSVERCTLGLFLGFCEENRASSSDSELSRGGALATSAVVISISETANDCFACSNVGCRVRVMQ